MHRSKSSPSPAAFHSFDAPCALIEIAPRRSAGAGILVKRARPVRRDAERAGGASRTARCGNSTTRTVDSPLSLGFFFSCTWGSRSSQLHACRVEACAGVRAGGVTSVTAECDGCPDNFDNAERPRSGKEPISARQEAATRERKKASMTSLQRVHEHHELTGCRAETGSMPG